MPKVYGCGPHHFNADPDQDPDPSFHFNAYPDPDPSFHFNADPDPDPSFHCVADPDPDPTSHFRIRILLVIKVMRICDHWSTDPPRLHFESPRPHCSVCGPPLLRFEPLKLLNFDFNADLDSDPAFHSKTDLDPDPASQNYNVPCGSESGSATLLHRAGCSPGSPHAAAHPVRLGRSPEAVLLPADIVVTVPQAVCTQFLFRDDRLPMWERQAPKLLTGHGPVPVAALRREQAPQPVLHLLPSSRSAPPLQGPLLPRACLRHPSSKPER
jgi:hypothetical protein